MCVYFFNDNNLKDVLRSCVALWQTANTQTTNQKSQYLTATRHLSADEETRSFTPCAMLFQLFPLKLIDCCCCIAAAPSALVDDFLTTACFKPLAWHTTFFFFFFHILLLLVWFVAPFLLPWWQDTQQTNKTRRWPRDTTPTTHTTWWWYVYLLSALVRYVCEGLINSVLTGARLEG